MTPPAVFFAATVLAPVCFFAAAFSATVFSSVFPAGPPAAFRAVLPAAAGFPATVLFAAFFAADFSATAFFAAAFFAAVLFAAVLFAAVFFGASSDAGAGAAGSDSPGTPDGPADPVAPAAAGDFFAAVFFATMSRPLHIL
ncbi:hypothetical protein [Streptomyces griseus]|uniref:hypothetical protein n=1 Tax=Streptomyces griseus TaxID=1911 RepID=UPI001F2610FE|nr:hypothetical protein [Streptomyces griseus]